jgi:type III pantothenate kinase
MKLLVDLGNTRLKWALWDGTALRAGGAVAHTVGVTVDFAALWKDINAIDAVLVASVAGAAIEQALAGYVRERFGAEAAFLVSRACACGVRNAYPEPERLGIDRFLTLIAVHLDAHEATVIASCGTALTLDAVGAGGVHLGGLIAASPELALAALRGGTAQLGTAAAGRTVEIADNTADAMASGTWLAAAALLERFVAQAAQQFGAAPALVLTGGGAARLAALLTLPHRIDAELVLRGLACVAEAKAESHLRRGVR